MADETQDKKIHSRDLSVGLIQGMDRLSPSMIKAIDGTLWLFTILILFIFLYLFGQILFYAVDVTKHGGLQNFEEFNKTLITFGSLIGALITLGFLVWRTSIAQKQNTIAQENMHSTTMAKAIEQLGAMKEEKITQGHAGVENAAPQETVTNSKPNIEVRLGAIYLLEKLAREHEQLHWPIMEILCAYVRENAGPPQVPPDDVIAAYAIREEERTDAQKVLLAKRKENLKPPRVDIQAAITVIGRRSAKQVNWERQLAATHNRAYWLDLSNCHLAKVQMERLEFSHADFRGSSLEDSNLSEVRLEGTWLQNTHLEGAALHEAHLERARLSGAHLDDTWIDDANLSDAIGFSQEMADKAWGNAETILPSNIDRPVNERWAQDESDDTEERTNRWDARREYWLDLAKKRAKGNDAD